MECKSTGDGSLPWSSELTQPRAHTNTTTESQSFRQDSVAQELYEYATLELEQSIRILVLLPGRHKDPICCKFQEVNLRDNPSYEALTWIWDGSSSRHLISVINENGNDGLLLTLSILVIALKALRHENELKYL